MTYRTYLTHLVIQENTMIVRTLFILFNLVMLASLAVTGKAQNNANNREVSAKVRSELFKQVLADMSDFRECAGKRIF